MIANVQRLALLLAVLLGLNACGSPGLKREIDRGRELAFPREMTQDPEGGRNWPGEEELNSPGLDTVDLEACLRYGLARNAGLHSAFERWRAAMEKITEVSTLPDPRFTFGQYIERVQTRTGAQENTFSLSQTFPWFGKLETRGDVQRQEARKLWAVLNSRKLAVAREIRTAFFEYAYLNEALRITKDNLVLLKRLEPVAQRKIQGGGGQDDLIRLQVEIGRIENEIETLKKFRGPLSARLRAAMNWPGDELLPWPRSKSKADQVFEVSALKELLKRSNPELQVLREEIEKQARRIELARLDRWPDFTLGANYIATDEAQSPSVSGSGDDPVIFTLSFNLPIQRRRYDAAENEARALQAAAVRSLEQKENDLTAALELAAYKLDDAYRQVALYRDSLLPRARQALEVTEVAYRGGTATFTDLIDSQRVLLAFEKAHERARADYEQALAALEEICGETLK